LSRHQRRHPFRGANPSEEDAVRADIGEAITSVKGLVITITLLAMSRQERLFCHEWIDEIGSDVRLQLFQKSLPAYDAWRIPHTKVSTFLATCILNCVRTSLHRLRRQRDIEDSGLDFETPAPDGLLDRHIEALAGAIIKNPLKFGLDPALPAVLRQDIPPSRSTR
jgi:hypothetical protein